MLRFKIYLIKRTFLLLNISNNIIPLNFCYLTKWATRENGVHSTFMCTNYRSIYSTQFMYYIIFLVSCTKCKNIMPVVYTHCTAFLHGISLKRPWHTFLYRVFMLARGIPCCRRAIYSYIQCSRCQQKARICRQRSPDGRRRV